MNTRRNTFLANNSDVRTRGRTQQDFYSQGNSVASSKRFQTFVSAAKIAGGIFGGVFAVNDSYAQMQSPILQSHLVYGMLSLASGNYAEARSSFVGDKNSVLTELVDNGMVGARGMLLAPTAYDTSVATSRKFGQDYEAIFNGLPDR